MRKQSSREKQSAAPRFTLAVNQGKGVKPVHFVTDEKRIFSDVFSNVGPKWTLASVHLEAFLNFKSILNPSSVHKAEEALPKHRGFPWFDQAN